MCWLSVVVRSPPARRSLSWIQSLLIELRLLVTEVSNLSLILLTTQTMVTTGILPLQGKIPMVEPGIEPGTSWLVVRSSDHQTTRLVIIQRWEQKFWDQYLFKSLDVTTIMRRGVLSISVSLSIYNREISPEPRKGVPWNFILVGFSKMARSIPLLFKIWLI